jgi:hypothetical protein
MLILFLLFLIQFSIACACLAVNTKQQEQLAEEVILISKKYWNDIYYLKLIKYNNFRVGDVLDLI